MKFLLPIITFICMSPLFASAQVETLTYGPYNTTRFSSPTTIHVNDNGILSISVQSIDGTIQVYKAIVVYGNGEEQSLPALEGPYDRQQLRQVQLPARRNLKYLTLEVSNAFRSRRGQFNIYITKQIDRNEPIDPRDPRHPHDPPIEPLPPSVQDGDLSGNCRDRNEFELAHQFAESYDGLSYNQNEARRWGREYIRTHACGTISEFSVRYKALYDFYTSLRYANYNHSTAQSRSLDGANWRNRMMIQRMKNTYEAIYSFYYDNSYLNQTSRRATENSVVWVETQGCLGVPNVDQIKSDYTRLYNLFNRRYNSRQSQEMAVERLKRTTSKCVELIEL